MVQNTQIIDLPDILKRYPCDFVGYPGTSVNIIPKNPDHTNDVKILLRVASVFKKFRLYTIDDVDLLKAENVYIEKRFSGIYAVAEKHYVFHVIDPVLKFARKTFRFDGELFSLNLSKVIQSKSYYFRINNKLILHSGFA